MRGRTVSLLIFAATLGLLLVFSAFFAVGPGTSAVEPIGAEGAGLHEAASRTQQPTARTLDRDADPVVVTGSQMPAFAGVALNRLFVYAYRGGVWQQIPWQFDEVVSGHITATEDSRLDNDDQLALMAGDTGDQAPAGSWIANADSRHHPRYEIVVSDPLAPAKQGWVYVYRSATDAEGVATDYADFDAAHWLFTAERYLLGIIPHRMAAERLEMNGSGVDVLDRTKLRVAIPLVSQPLTEDSLEIVGAPAVRDGRVRAFGTYAIGSNELTLIAYRSMYRFLFDVNVTAELPFITTLDWIRISADLSPAAAGSTYYDANTGNGVPVDGQPETVATAPATDWWQVSGSSGTVVQIADLTHLGGTRSNYYKDDARIDAGDTGDKKSYADCGARVARANAHVIVDLWYYVLPANLANVGATYRERAMHPLQAEGTEQKYEGSVPRAWLPRVMGE